MSKSKANTDPKVTFHTSNKQPLYPSKHKLFNIPNSDFI